MKFRTEFGEHVVVGVDCNAADPVTGEIPMCHVKQADKEACDINRIMARFEQTGQLPDMIRAEPRYGDFSNVNDYMTSCNTVMKAEQQFAALSAHVRDRFDNDPIKMLEFCADPRNGDEMVKLGLALPRKPEAPVGGPPQPSEPPAGAPPSAKA